LIYPASSPATALPPLPTQAKMSTYAAETPRLYLERLSLSKHLDDFHELWNNDEAVLWSSKPAKKTIEESKEWMVQYILPTASTQDIDKFALLLKDPGAEGVKGEDEEGRKKLKMIGFVGTNRWCEQGMEVGYCMNISYWGHRYATEGMIAFLKIFWGLPERRGIERLVAKTHPDNVASRKVCLKSGGRRGEVLEGGL